MGRTGGDTVVYLPKEKIVATGDLMESRVHALSVRAMAPGEE